MEKGKSKKKKMCPLPNKETKKRTIRKIAKKKDSTLYHHTHTSYSTLSMANPIGDMTRSDVSETGKFTLANLCVS